MGRGSGARDVTDEAEEMDADEALAAIGDAITREQALRSRTEGLTWMIWGIVTAGWKLTYDAVAWAFRPAPPELMVDLIWLPWVVMGGLTTTALWATAALAEPNLDEERPAGLWVTVGWTAFVILVWAVLFFGLAVALDFPGNADTMSLIVLGITWATFGAVEPVRLTDRGRRVTVAVGAILGVVGLMAAFGVPPGEPAQNRVSTVLATSFGGVVPLLAGLWQALRG